MFKVVPSLSISERKVVRLMQGDFSKQLKYNYSPLDVANLLQDNGIQLLQFVDLDGMKKESPVNYNTLEMIVGHTGLKVDFSGGIRTDGDINKVLEYGATFFTASSVAVNNHDLFDSWIVSYGREKLSMMADSLDKKIIYKAWQRKTDLDLFDHIKHFYNRGLKYIKVTDIARDGLLEGPNFDLYKELIAEFPDAFIAASGGVRSIDDVKRLKEMGLYGVIIGRALYEDKIKLSEVRKFIED